MGRLSGIVSGVCSLKVGGWRWLGHILAGLRRIGGMQLG